MSSAGGVLARAARAGALSVRMEMVSDNLIGVVTWMSPLSRSSFFSDWIKADVTKLEKRSVLTRMS